MIRALFLAFRCFLTVSSHSEESELFGVFSYKDTNSNVLGPTIITSSPNMATLQVIVLRNEFGGDTIKSIVANVNCIIGIYKHT